MIKKDIQEAQLKAQQRVQDARRIQKQVDEKKKCVAEKKATELSAVDYTKESRRRISQRRTMFRKQLQKEMQFVIASQPTSLLSLRARVIYLIGANDPKIQQTMENARLEKILADH
ncbi:hypothetical protein FGIG_08452 [Fasciola gigantica]|uniref:Uncharacterized protein n=1 Tax=Fasciola gigantica TaxID=46835 RepID=A0A504YF69_FASGI|nr:hypothetical protein FGIG_08452 [Fasciola gigantica]